MFVLSHGGYCCGVKHIYGLFSHPDVKMEAIKDADAWRIQLVIDSRERLAFVDPVPKQTARERFNHLVNKMRLYKKQGLMEVTLTSGIFDMGLNGDYNPQPQVDVWGPVVEAAGFVKVLTFKNSNSGNYVTVYHLNHDTVREKAERAAAMNAAAVESPAAPDTTEAVKPRRTRKKANPAD